MAMLGTPLGSDVGRSDGTLTGGMLTDGMAIDGTAIDPTATDGTTTLAPGEAGAPVPPHAAAMSPAMASEDTSPAVEKEWRMSTSEVVCL
jgi:hypothetical protein